MRNHPGFRLGAFLLPLLGCAPASAWAQAVTTYHGDTLRTGWNAAEKTLTVANVGGGNFDLQAMTTLDSQVDAQPLVVPNVTIAGASHRVVYVVTAGDRLYAIDGTSGAILKSRIFGTPIPRSALPGGCSNNGPTIGILSTPAIDKASGTMYLMVDTYENSSAIYRVHAVSLSTLQDTVKPVVVTASATLSDGTRYAFNANVQRQRPALLLAGSTLYAAFGSYCDQASNITRGWLLGWSVPSLAPIAHNQLQDQVSTSQSNYFLNSIWMSGFGPAAAGGGSPVYFLNSNSDADTYGSANRDESVMKVSSNLDTIESYYTAPNYATLDAEDDDLGSGGAMLTPEQPGAYPRLLFAAGKPGTMYMFSGSTTKGLGLLSSYSIGNCYCGPSYFTGSDNVGRVVSSGGSNVILWQIVTSASAAPTLTQQFSTSITSGQDHGFFTSVSSNGTAAGTAVIWAVGRPSSAPGTIPLYAIDPSTGQIIYTATAGNWEYGNSNANTVPTISAGHVYVASYQELAIFGLGHPADASAQMAFSEHSRSAAAQAQPGFQLAGSQHAIWGTIQIVTEDEMELRIRSGALVWVALGAARDAGNLASPVVGEAAVAIGRFTGGVLVASNVEHAKAQPALWPQDQ